MKNFISVPNGQLIKLFTYFIMGTSFISCNKDKETTEIPVPVTELKAEVITSSLNGFAVNSTLITGKKEAVLIDAQFLNSDADALIKKIIATGKTLTTVYITHSHPDHYFGLTQIRKAFPNTHFVALPSVVKDIEATWKSKVETWKPVYGDNITSNPIIPEVLNGTKLALEGNDIQIIANVQGDEANNSYVWIPALKTVVCGDIDYNGVFPWTLETTPTERLEWIKTLAAIRSLQPEVVVPGHQDINLKNDISSIKFTQDYLTYYDSVLPLAKTSTEFQAIIKGRYPNVLLDVILKTAADATFQGK